MNITKSSNKLQTLKRYAGRLEKFSLMDPKRRKLLEKAIGCSNMCARAHYMIFEIDHKSREDVSFDSDEELLQAQKEMIAPLYEAGEAGRRLKAFIGTDEFCKGNLFSYQPTRFYVRSLFGLGSMLFGMGELDEAEPYLKECLASDVHDKLGARHKQLLVNLERSGGAKGADVKYLLKATFGDDQKQDDIYALWNYTRALHAYNKKGKSKEAGKLLKKAIERNPHVPPLLLSWELPQFGPDFIQLGKIGEGSDYAKDNAKYWSDSALEWLEDVYCKSANVPPPLANPTARRQLLAGTKLMTEAQNVLPTNLVALEEAISEFESLLHFLDRSIAGQKQLRKEVLQRKGICHCILGENELAVQHFNSALCLCIPTDSESVKHLYYARANAKEKKGDLRGAYEDFKFVYQNIDKVSTARDGIRRLEKKLQVDESVIPTPHFDYAGIDDSVAELKAFERTLSRTLPKNDHNDSVAGRQERCAQCGRGGIRLFKCSGCKDSRYIFCSKDCQAENWRVLHKYICTTSKHRLDPGTQVHLRKLNNAAFNDKEATVVSFQEEQGRFCVQVQGSHDGSPSKEIAVKPVNMKRMTK